MYAAEVLFYIFLFYFGFNSISGSVHLGTRGSPGSTGPPVGSFY